MSAWCVLTRGPKAWLVSLYDQVATVVWQVASLGTQCDASSCMLLSAAGWARIAVHVPWDPAMVVWHLSRHLSTSDIIGNNGL